MAKSKKKLPKHDSKSKKELTVIRPNAQKEVHIGSNPNKFGNTMPKWTFARVDKDSWTIHDTFINTILEKLIQYESMTWNEIMNMTRQGRNSNNTMNHNIPRGALIKSAQQRLDQLKIYEDEIFSLSLDNKKRLWGILDSGVFQIIWYDSNHEICVSKKKHT